MAEAVAAPTDPRRELIKVLFEGFSEYPKLMARMQEILIGEEIALNKAGMNISRLADPSLIPRLIGNNHPELIGKYILYTIKVTDLLREVADPSKLTIQQKQEKIKRFLELSDEVKVIGEEARKTVV
jgi:hypothetical protein